MMAMTRAMKDGGVAPDEVDYIAAHGTSTALNDATETRAIKGALGAHAHKVAISSPKSMVGHTIGAAGVVNAFAAIGAIREGIVPPTINLDNPDLPELDLDYVPLVARKQKVDTAMINGFGFGGQNAVAVFRRFEP
jgi:3-oxoacyl-[acyl-carrier-protein] synthase II